MASRALKGFRFRLCPGLWATHKESDLSSLGYDAFETTKLRSYRLGIGPAGHTVEYEQDYGKRVTHWVHLDELEAETFCPVARIVYEMMLELFHRHLGEG